MFQKIIFVSAGGTGGHIFPALTLSSKLKKQGYKLYFITDKRGLRFLSDRKNNNLFERVFTIPASGFAGKSIVYKLKSIFNVLIGLLISIVIVLRFKPKLSIGFGGYTTVPVIIISKLLCKKVIIHSADTVFGLSNKILSFFSDKICTSFKEVKNIPNSNINKVVFTSLPVQEDFYKYANAPYLIKDNKIKILITGGSLGASSLSTPIALAVQALPIKIKNRLHIYHQVYSDSLHEVIKIYKKNNISANVATFFNNIPNLLKGCNLFIGRSGASTIHELMIIKRPSILVPLIHKDRHQIFNAEVLEKTGGAIIVLQDDNFVDSLKSSLLYLLSDKSRLNVMYENLQQIKFENSIFKMLEIVNNFMR